MNKITRAPVFEVTATGHSRRELAGFGALVLLLGSAFVFLVVEPTQASAPPSAHSELATLLR